MATDYFTKWVEAEALANILDVDTNKFVWKNIMTRFGVLEALILDNRLHFDSKAFKKYCGNLGDQKWVFYIGLPPKKRISWSHQQYYC